MRIHGSGAGSLVQKLVKSGTKRSWITCSQGSVKNWEIEMQCFCGVSFWNYFMCYCCLVEMLIFVQGKGCKILWI